MRCKFPMYAEMSARSATFGIVNVCTCDNISTSPAAVPEKGAYSHLAQMPSSLLLKPAVTAENNSSLKFKMEEA